MTVIAWDGEVLATDTQCTLGNAKYSSPKAWYESYNGQVCIMSGVGTLKCIHRHRHWLVTGGNLDSFPYAELEQHYYQFLLVTQLGLLRYEGTPYPVEHGVRSCAFGEASDFAYGALGMGAKATEAVRVAIQYSHQCGGDIESYSLLRREE